MAVKKFYASDMRSAMKTIRAQLGEDAIILSTRKLVDGVEVSASADAGGMSGGAFSGLQIISGEHILSDRNRDLQAQGVGFTNSIDILLRNIGTGTLIGE